MIVTGAELAPLAFFDGNGRELAYSRIRRSAIVLCERMQCNFERLFTYGPKSDGVSEGGGRFNRWGPAMLIPLIYLHELAQSQASVAAFDLLILLY